MTIDDKFRAAFSRYAEFVYYFRYVSIIFPVIIAALLSTGLLFMEDRLVTDPNYLFAPINGPGQFEKKVGFLNESSHESDNGH